MVVCQCAKDGVAGDGQETDRECTVNTGCLIYMQDAYINPPNFSVLVGSIVLSV